MDPVLDALLRGSVERLDRFSREAFKVGVTLSGSGSGSEGACLCAQGAADEACRAFARALATGPAQNGRCPRGLRVVARPVSLPGEKALLVASQGFLRDDDPPPAAAGAAPAASRLSAGEAALFETFVGMSAGLLGAIAPVARAFDAEGAREGAWRDLLGAPAVLGESHAARQLREALPAAANSAEPLFLAGEPGSGRRLLAAAVHRLGPRAAGPFIAERLGAVPEALQETEIFGADGAPGLVEEAVGGTLYLADVERLTPRSQQLLREFLGAGPGEAPQRGARIIASADADLEAAVRREGFSGELAARLRARTLVVAPLRERVEDIPQVAAHLVRRRAAAAGLPPPELLAETVETLKSRIWAGNVRELDEELARAAAGRTVIRPEDVSARRAPRPASAPATGTTLRDAVGGLEMSLIEQALADSNWNKSRAARRLGLSRLGLQKKIDRYGIDRRR